MINHRIHNIKFTELNCTSSSSFFLAKTQHRFEDCTGSIVILKKASTQQQQFVDSARRAKSKYGLTDFAGILTLSVQDVYCCSRNRNSFINETHSHRERNLIFRIRFEFIEDINEECFALIHCSHLRWANLSCPFE